MEQQQHLFTNKMLRALLVPIIMEQLLNALMGTVDTMMVSNVGSAAISAVSLVDSINVLIIQAFSALAAGGTIICTQYLGQKNHEMANKSARQALFIITAISVCIVAVGLLFRAPLLGFIFGKVDADVMDNSMVYFFYTVLSYPFIALYDAGASIFRAQENTRGPMVISIISNVMNIVGNGILIWVFHMGVAGAAISTLVSRSFCAVVVLYQLRKDRQPIVVRDYLKIRPDGKMIGRILALGIPSGIENSMFQLGKLAIQSTVSTLGTTAIAAQAMTNMLEMLNGTAVIGVGIGLMTVVGQSLGAGRRDEAVLLHEEADDFRRSLFDRMLRYCVCVYETNYSDWGNGAGKCQKVPGHDVLDYHCEANRLDAGIYSGLRHEGCRGCEIFHGHFLHHHVGIPFLSVCLSDPGSRNGTYGCVDRYVYGLDGAGGYIFPSV